MVIVDLLLFCADPAVESAPRNGIGYAIIVILGASIVAGQGL